MPTSPSMKVIALRQEAVLTKPGSWVARPPGSPSTASCFRSAARMVPSVTGTSYSWPVRLSRMVMVSARGVSTSVESAVDVSVMGTNYAGALLTATLGDCAYRPALAPERIGLSTTRRRPRSARCQPTSVLLRGGSAGILVGCCAHAAGSRCARVVAQRQFVPIFRKQSTSVSTFSPKPGDVTRTWHVIDAEDIVLGRLAVTAATLLRGKHKPTYAPHVDGGDFVIVVNASKVALTGNKRTDKLAYRHSGRPGGLKTTSYGDLLDSDPREAVERAVWGM